MARIQFSTDSAADIPASLREELNIHVFPFPVAMGDKEYRDGVDYAPQEFYEMLLAAPKIPTHAQLTAFQFQEYFEEVWKEGYDHLIHTSINSKGSTTCQNAYQARDEFYEEHPEAKETFQIHIIDSLTYTVCYGWAVIQGARMAADGIDAQEIVDYIQDWVDHAHVLFAPLDLRFAKKSGRVSAAAAFVGEALGLKPIMTFTDGESKVLAKVRGEKNVISTMLDMCKKERQPGTPYMVLRGNNDEQADKLLETCKSEMDQPPVDSFYIGGVIAINAGPNLIGVLYRG